MYMLYMRTVYTPEGELSNWKQRSGSGRVACHCFVFATKHREANRLEAESLWTVTPAG